MKKSFRFSQIAGLVVVLLASLAIMPKGSTYTLSYAEAAALANLGAMPQSLENTFPQSNNMGNNNVALDYAIPADVHIFNSAPTDSGSSYTHYKKTPIFQDLNGDGLADLIYSAPFENQNETYSQYVLINNGHGFNIAYYCRKNNADMRGHCTN